MTPARVGTTLAPMTYSTVENEPVNPGDQRIHIRVSRPLHAEISKFARALNLSNTRAINNLLRVGLRHFEADPGGFMVSYSAYVEWERQQREEAEKAGAAA